MIHIQRSDSVLKPDTSRVLLRPFFPSSNQRFYKIVKRVLSLTEEEAGTLSEQIVAEFSRRHGRFRDYLQNRYDQLRYQYSLEDSIPEAKRLLIASCFAQEYSLESAALFNPAIVPHPDQSGLSEGILRFILSLRATGEGHISSLVFRSGLLDVQCEVKVDPPTHFVFEPTPIPNVSYYKDLFERKLREVGFSSATTQRVMQPLPDLFTLKDLEDRLREVATNHEKVRDMEKSLILRGVQMLAKSNFEVRFPSELSVSERAIFPVSPSQINGIEDARFVLFQNEDGTRTYYATYSAFDGKLVLPQLLETADFLHFKFNTLNGTAVQNKGMALFPRKINGRYAMLSRQDNENIFIMFSDNIHFWYSPEVILEPKHPWEFIQMGNCGSPIETEHGWLVLSHGVGPMRRYCLGAFLLDLKNPQKVISRLREPLLKPNEIERNGYVPNVVYTCGVLLHQGRLVIPYAMSDHATGFATVPLEEVLAAMQ